MSKISNKFHQEALTIIFFSVMFTCIALKLENVGLIFQVTCFNPRLSLSSVATEDREQFLCQNIFLQNKTGPLFLEFN